MKIVLGPPGTGKTTKLLNLVEYYLEKGVPPDKIGYFAFTRRAAIEAIERASVKFNLTKKDLPFFRTLHSLAFMQAGLKHSQVITSEHYQDVADWLRIGNFYLDSGSIDQGPYKDIGYGDKFLEIINMSRILQKPLKEVYAKSNVQLKTDWYRVSYVNRGIRHFKKAKDLYDYTDMLEVFVNMNLAPRLEVVFIDEAQDLSPIQWKMVELLEKNSKECYVAGDDDQAIFRYAGADVNHFVNLEGEVSLLNQSYRIPSLHHGMANKVINQIVGRREKQFAPREEDGLIKWYSHSAEVDLKDGEWLLLARTNRGAQQIEEEVRTRGHLYVFNNSRSIDKKTVDAVRLWQGLLEGNRITKQEVKLVYSKMLLRKQIEYGCKTMPNGKEGQLYSLEELRRDHGLLHSLPWEHGLGKIADKDKQYLKSCLRKGESLAKEPRIRISTIHSSKGAQADNVMLLTDTMRRPYSMWRKDEHHAEDEARVFYVGLTRAKNNLHLIHPMFSQGYNIPQ